MKLVTEENKQAYQEFVENHERSNFQQSMEWSKVKQSWRNEILIVEDKNGNIIGSISILIRKIPFFGNMMYAPRGPVCDIHNKEVLQELTQSLQELAKRENAFVLKMEPDIESKDTEFRKIAEELGYKIKDDAKNFSEEIQPRYVFKLNIKDKTKDEVFQNFHSKTRYNIRLGLKKGVVVKEGNREDLKDFHKIMLETGKRDGFLTRPLEYFETMYDALVPKGYMKLLMAYYEDKPIAGIIPIIYGNKTCYLYGASSNSHRNLMPNYLLQWQAIQDAIERKQDVYDFRGVSGVVDENHPQYGLYRFKKGFGADFTEYIGELYIPFKKTTYHAYQIADKIRKKLLLSKSKIQKQGENEKEEKE